MAKRNVQDGSHLIAGFSYFIAYLGESHINNGNNLDVQDVLISQEPLVTASTRP